MSKARNALFGCSVVGAPFAFILIVFAGTNFLESRQRSEALSTVATAGQQAFFTAARRGDLASLRAAIRQGQDVNAREPAHSRTALMRAAAFNRSEAVELLLASGADAGLMDLENHTALQIATKAEATDVLPVLSRARRR